MIDKCSFLDWLLNFNSETEGLTKKIMNIIVGPEVPHNIFPKCHVIYSLFRQKIISSNVSWPNRHIAEKWHYRNFIMSNFIFQNGPLAEYYFPETWFSQSSLPPTCIQPNAIRTVENLRSSVSGENIFLKIGLNSWISLKTLEFFWKSLKFLWIYRTFRTFQKVKLFSELKCPALIGEYLIFLRIFLEMYENLWKFVGTTLNCLKNSGFLWKFLIF